MRSDERGSCLPQCVYSQRLKSRLCALNRRNDKSRELKLERVVGATPGVAKLGVANMHGVSERIRTTWDLS